jgi:BirA family biotin operon repressor/biotin-[acetyl-CoA-carboxylase] ligase
LIEGGQAKPTEPSWMIVGIGLNLRNANSIEKNLPQASTKVSSLEELLPKGVVLPDTEYLWLSLLDSLEQHFQNFDLRGFAPYQLIWSTWDAYANQTVCLSGGGKEPIYGLAKGIGMDGALLLEQEGKIISIYAGDVSLRVQP